MPNGMETTESPILLPELDKETFLLVLNLIYFEQVYVTHEQKLALDSAIKRFQIHADLEQNDDDKEIEIVDVKFNGDIKPKMEFKPKVEFKSEMELDTKPKRISVRKPKPKPKKKAKKKSQKPNKNRIPRNLKICQSIPRIRKNEYIKHSKTIKKEPIHVQPKPRIKTENIIKSETGINTNHDAVTNSNPETNNINPNLIKAKDIKKEPNGSEMPRIKSEIKTEFGHNSVSALDRFPDQKVNLQIKVKSEPNDQNSSIPEIVLSE